MPVGRPGAAPKTSKRLLDVLRENNPDLTAPVHVEPAQGKQFPPNAKRLVEVLQLNNPAASLVANVLDDVLHGGGRKGDSPRITADVNGNSIVVYGTVQELDEIRTSSSFSMHRSSGRATLSLGWRHTTFAAAIKLLRNRPPASPLLRRRR